MTNMNEQQFANRIRQALTEGARLDARILERLRAAREHALERRRVAPLGWREPAGAHAGGETGSLGGFGAFSLRVVLPIVLMIAGVVGIYRWQQEQRAAEAEQIDAQLLSDDLPIDAYLDRGFEAWLKKNASR